MSAKRKSNTGIPGLSFSWKRAVDLSGARQRFARQTGIPTTRGGVEQKIGRIAIKGCLSVFVCLAVFAGMLVFLIN